MLWLHLVLGLCALATVTAQALPPCGAGSQTVLGTKLAFGKFGSLQLVSSDFSCIYRTWAPDRFLSNNTRDTFYLTGYQKNSIFFSAPAGLFVGLLHENGTLQTFQLFQSPPLSWFRSLYYEPKLNRLFFLNSTKWEGALGSCFPNGGGLIPFSIRQAWINGGLRSTPLYVDAETHTLYFGATTNYGGAAFTVFSIDLNDALAGKSVEATSVASQSLNTNFRGQWAAAFTVLSVCPKKFYLYFGGYHMSRDNGPCCSGGTEAQIVRCDYPSGQNRTRVVYAAYKSSDLNSYHPSIYSATVGTDHRLSIIGNDIFSSLAAYPSNGPHSDYYIAFGATNPHELSSSYRAINNPNGISAAIEWSPSACSVGCGPMGYCSDKQRCTCQPTFVGNGCQCSGRWFCSGNGDCQTNGNDEFSCSCKPNYYGSSCQTYCVDSKNCSGFGHCNSAGGCECNPGWSGPTCREPPHTGLATWGTFQSDFIVQSPKPLKYRWWFSTTLQSQRFDVIDGSLVASYYYRYDQNTLYSVKYFGGTPNACQTTSLGFKTFTNFPTLTNPKYQGYFDCQPAGRSGSNCEKWFADAVEFVPLVNEMFLESEEVLSFNEKRDMNQQGPKVIFGDVDLPGMIQTPIYLMISRDSKQTVPIQLNTFNTSSFGPAVFAIPSVCQSS